MALFADSSWRKYLPPDETGEFKRVRASRVLKGFRLHALPSLALLSSMHAL